MKVLAPFDGSKFSEATLEQLKRLAAIPTAEFILMSVAGEPSEKARTSALRAPAVADSMGEASYSGPRPRTLRLAETKTQAIQRRRAELVDYLEGLARKLPKGTRYSTVGRVTGDHPADVIISQAKKLEPDVIVMATHGHGGLRHAIFGSVTEEVMRSGVAPVLVVRPRNTKAASNSKSKPAKKK
jgi:nucleotide-binding universal stress UspA family protein